MKKREIRKDKTGAKYYRFGSKIKWWAILSIPFVILTVILYIKLI